MIARLPSSLSPRIARFALLALATYIVEGAVVASGRLARSPELGGAAITFDLVIGVPLAWWLLVVRAGTSARTMIPVVLASIAGARLILPAEQQGMLPWMRWLIAPFEMAVIAWVAWQVRAIVRRRRAERAGAAADEGHDLLADLAAVLEPVFGKGAVARTALIELALMYYALASWGRRPHVPAGARAMAVEGNLGLVIGLSMAVAVETVALHLFVASHWGATWAWILTATSIYTVLWFVGDFRAIELRPSYVTSDSLVLRHGLRADAVVSRATIERVESITWRTLPAKSSDYLDLSRPGEPNIVLHLGTPAEVRLLFGRRRTVSRVGLRVERASEAIAMLAPSEPAR